MVEFNWIDFLLVVNILALDAYKSTRLRLFPVIDHMGGMLVGLLSGWIIVTIAINVLVYSSNTQSWGTVDSFRESLQTGLDLSRPADVTTTTLPMIVASIRPWLPGGLPALFQL